MLDFRWYLATLTAILAALAVGIVVGSAALGPEVWTAHEGRLVADIEGRLGELRQEEARRQREAVRLQKELEAARAFEEAAAAWLVRGRLEGVRVALVAAGDGAPAGAAAGALQAAEAVVSWRLEVPARWPADARLTGVLGVRPTPEAAATRLGEALAAGDRLTLEALAGAGAVRLVAAPPAAPPGTLQGTEACRVLVLVTGAGPVDGRPLLALARAAAREGARVVVASPTGAAFDPAAAVGPGVATVDDLDRPAGLAALVLAAAGSDGRFGVRPGALPLPAPPAAGAAPPPPPGPGAPR
ncbi:MAG: copper transporter [Firmicutes bacterium]|nr:copper transporter [Bacillota bacterium]